MPFPVHFEAIEEYLTLLLQESLRRPEKPSASQLGHL